MTQQPNAIQEVAPEEVQQKTKPSGFTWETKDDYNLSTLSGCLVALTPTILGFLWVAESIWRPLGTVLYLLMMGFSFAVVSDTMLRRKKKVVPGAATQAAVLAALVVIVVGFSQISRHYYIRHGGYEAANANYWHWLRYGTDSVVDAMLRGIPTVWNWNITEITPVAFWPRVMLVLFQLAADVLAIGGLIGFVQKLFTERAKVQPEQGSYPRFMVGGIGHILGLALWGIPLTMGIDAMMRGGWNPGSTWPAIQTAAPMVLSIWLMQRSWRGLRVLQGRWNKLGALAGTGVGVWLVWWSWQAVRLFIDM